MLVLVVLLIIVFSCSNDNNTNNSEGSDKPTPTDPYFVEEVRFTNNTDDSQLVGTLTLPAAGKDFAAVILLSGSGLQDRDETVYGHKPFKVLADYFTRQGIAVLRYDDRGIGKSVGPLKNSTPENFARDALAGIMYLKSRSEISNNKIGIIGHSMGAIEGSILASRYDDISFLIMLGGPGIPLEENILKSDSTNNFRSGQSMAVINSGQKLLKKMMAEVKKDYDEMTTEKNLNIIIEKWRNSLPDQEKDGIDSFTTKKPDHWQQMASEWATPYFRFVVNYDPSTVLEEIKCPVLSLIGEKDVQVLPEENSLRIRESLEKGKCRNFHVEIKKDLNHLFQYSKLGVISEYSRIESTFDISTMKQMVKWIEQQTKSL